LRAALRRRPGDADDPPVAPGAGVAPDSSGSREPAMDRG